MKLFAVVMMASLGLAAAAGECSASGVNPFGYFNVYSLGGISQSGGDYQGRAGAGGDVSMAHFSLNLLTPGGYALHAGGGATLGSGVYFGHVEAAGNVSLANATIQGDLRAGGNVGNTAGGTIWGDVQAAGSITLDQHYTVFGSKQGGVSYSPAVDHGVLADYFTGFSGTVGGMSPTGSIASAYGTLSVVATSGVNVFALSEAALRAAHTFNVTGPADAVVYINVSGASASLDNTVWHYLGGLSPAEVLLNFPEATVLALSHANEVNLLAPLADTTFPSGLVTGNLVVGELSGGGQVNAGGFGHGPNPVPVPASVLLLGSGLGGLLAIRRGR
ncbi:MAG: choice-of-anchor A family protein [Thermodesulfobacteriota bacterium]